MTGQPGRSGGKREGAGRPPGGSGGRSPGAKGGFDNVHPLCGREIRALRPNWSRKLPRPLTVRG
jgi:hypothetical protein